MVARSVQGHQELLELAILSHVQVRMLKCDSILYKYLIINYLHFLQLLKIVSGVNGIGKIALGQHVEQEDRVATGLSFNMPLMEVKRALEDQRLLGCVTHPCKPRQRWRM